jgi:hypothetical protein
MRTRIQVFCVQGNEGSTVLTSGNRSGLLYFPFLVRYQSFDKRVTIWGEYDETDCAIDSVS